MKRLSSFIVFIILLVPFLTFSISYADEFDGFTWSFKGGTLIIEGEGVLPDGGPWCNIASKVKKLEIGEKITSIFSMPELKSVETIVIHGNNTTMSPFAFTQSKKLNKLIFTGDNPSIGDEWFYANRLKSIVFENEKADYIIDGDYLLNKSKTILYYYFDGKKPAVTIPEGVITIASCAFANSKIKSVTFPSTLEAIQGYAFYHCEKLTDIVLPSSLKTLGRYVFNQSGLTTIEFQSESIDFHAYYNTWDCDGGWEFASTKLKKISLPACTQITDGMFSNCKQLTKIVFGEGTDCTLGLQTSPFNNCQKLETVYIPASVTNVDHMWFVNIGLPKKFMILGVRGSKVEEVANQYSIKYENVK